MLLRYRYLRPIGRRHQQGGAGDPPAYSLVFSGAIPAAAEESTEEVLERLWLRHSSEIRPQGRGEPPCATGDVLDLGERGIWQAVPLGFRALASEELRVEEAA